MIAASLAGVAKFLNDAGDPGAISLTDLKWHSRTRRHFYYYIILELGVTFIIIILELGVAFIIIILELGVAFIITILELGVIRHP